MNFKVFYDVLFKPKEVFAAEKAKGSLLLGLKNFVVAGFLFALSFLLLSFLFHIEPAAVDKNSIVNTILVIGSLIVYVVLDKGIVILIAFIVSRILGGKGSFTSMFYLTSIYAPATMWGILIPLVNILIGLYSMYLFYLVVKESQGLSTTRAALVVLWPYILVAILATFVIVLLAMNTAFLYNPANNPEVSIASDEHRLIGCKLYMDENFVGETTDKKLWIDLNKSQVDERNEHTFKCNFVGCRKWIVSTSELKRTYVTLDWNKGEFIDCETNEPLDSNEIEFYKILERYVVDWGDDKNN